MFWKRPKTLSPEQEEERRRELEQVPVGWKDRLAMAISAFLVLGLPAIVAILVLCFLAMALFGLL